MKKLVDIACNDDPPRYIEVNDASDLSDEEVDTLCRLVVSLRAAQKLREAHGCGWATAETTNCQAMLAERDRLKAQNEKLRTAIQIVLDDEESRPGAWGPDVTCVGILRDALKEGQ